VPGQLAELERFVEFDQRRHRNPPVADCGEG
jgi:hypothetical protein